MKSNALRVLITTQESVHAQIRNIFENVHFVVVSNREPYEHRFGKDKKGIRSHFMGGGVVRALDPVLQQLRGVWVAWGSGSADAATVDSNQCIPVPEKTHAYTLKRIFLSPKQVEGHYYGFSNQFLWPFFHGLTEIAHFSQPQWEAYKEVNEIFAQQTLQALKRGRRNLIWLHDYHLALAAQRIREVQPRAVLMIFWHIPWPKPDEFLRFGKAREFLRGLLCNDVIAFHSPRYSSNFIASVKEALGLSVRGDRIAFGLREVRVVSHPISIDTEQWVKEVSEIAPEREFRRYGYEALYEAPILGIGVDRLDYTKGLLEKVQALGIFFEKHPKYRKRVVFLQKTMSSRSRIKAYSEYAQALHVEIERVNKKFQTSSWKPIVHIDRDISHAFLLSIYRRGDFCLVSPLMDGLNLVAKEYIASQEGKKGVLLLSRFAGACEELVGQIEVDPHDPQSMAHQLAEALDLPEEIRELRMKKLISKVKKNNIYTWLLDNLRESLPKLTP